MKMIVGFSGSTRKDSYNKKILRLALQEVSINGVEVDYIDLRDYPLPLYDGDYEVTDGVPEDVKKLKSLLKQADGFIITSPEYNSGTSGVLKNFIDWCSRTTEENEKPLSCFKGKKALLISGSPGKLGGLRGLYALRNILENMKVNVMPDFLTFPHIDKLLHESEFINGSDSKKLIKSVSKFIETFK